MSSFPTGKSRGESAAATASLPDIDAALREIRSARERARGTADVIQGIPIYGSIWNTLFSIENALRAAERKLGGEPT